MLLAAPTVALQGQIMDIENYLEILVFHHCQSREIIITHHSRERWIFAHPGPSPPSCWQEK